jgi:MoaA/NifB/PqqE/SkfB family radical SAM enzyme
LKLLQEISTGAKIVQTHFLGTKRPLAISLSVTDRCNQRCEYCDIPLRNMRDLTTDQLVKIINELGEEGCERVVMTGGEASLRADIGTLIDAAKSHGIYTSMNSNGLLARRKIEELRKLDLIFISLDGPKEIHDQQRNMKDAFEKAVEAIKVFREYGVKVWTFTPLTKGDLAHVEWVVRKAEELDFYCDFGNLSDHYLAGDRLDPLYPDKDEHRRTVDWLLEEKKRNKHVGASVATLEFVRDMYRRNGTPYEQFPRCYSGKLFCYIDTNGDCYSCFDLRGMPKARGGNCVRDGVKKAFAGLPDMTNARCPECCCNSAIEINYLGDLNPHSVKNILRWV